MTYLSRLILDTRHPIVRRDLADCHQLHRRLLLAFPDLESTAARAQLGVLYRSEAIVQEPRLIRVLVQSAAAPDWSHLPERYLGPALDARGNPAVREIGAEYARIAVGDRLFFRLRANPTKRISDRTPGRENQLLGKRVALLREEEQLAWLARKGDQGGFRLVHVAAKPELPDVRVAAQEHVRGRRPDPAGERPHPLTFGAALFEGYLEVSDRDAFHATLLQGIGSGKAFGFGLLSIAAGA